MGNIASIRRIMESLEELLFKSRVGIRLLRRQRKYSPYKAMRYEVLTKF
jgi:hypothetical protein